MVFASSLQSSVSFFADGVDGGNVNQPENSNTTNNSSSNSNNVGGGSSGSGNFGGSGGNKKNLNKDIMVFVLILVAFLLVVGIAVFGFIHSKRDTFRQCNDKKVLAEVKTLLIQHPNFTKYNFGINPKKPFTITDITEFAPANATIHKRYCEALINNSTSIKYTVHSSLSGKNAIVAILPNY
jgi:preprotein translocase subunit SecG